VGVGDVRNSSKLDSSILSFMAKHHISIEALTTEQACATFNFLNAENRYIAGALIPPLTLRPTDDDVLISKNRHKRLYGSSDDDW
jgi:NADH dehydrogenase [ubiquinone] 1 alpha subcomplex assembly factor 3